MIASEEGQGDALSGATINNYEIQVIGPDDKFVNINNAGALFSAGRGICSRGARAPGSHAD